MPGAAHSNRPVWLWFGLLAAGLTIPAVWFPLFPHAADQLVDLRAFAPGLRGSLLYAALLIGLHAVWWAAVRAAGRAAVAPAWLLLGGLALGALLLPTYPINANDLFRYYLQGKVTALYGENPFTLPLDRLTAEPYLYLAGEWVYTTTPYGPAWELPAAAVVVLTGGGLLSGLLGFKLLGLLAHLGVGWLLGALTAERSAGERAALRAAWLWNPSLLFLFVMDAHNDALMLFWLLLGLWLVRRDRPLPGLWIMALGPLTKLIALPVWGLFVLEWLRARPSWRARLVGGATVAAGAALLTVGLFAPFGGGWALFGRLLAESRDDGGFSLLTLIILLGRQLGNRFGDAAWVLNAAQLLLVLSALGLAWAVWRGQSAVRSSAVLLWLYLLTAFKYRIWYSAWVYPWALLDGRPTPRRAAVLFLLMSQLSVVVYGQLRVELLAGSMLAAHAIATPAVFLFPWLAAQLWTAVVRRRDLVKSGTSVGFPLR